MTFQIWNKTSKITKNEQNPHISINVKRISMGTNNLTHIEQRLGGFFPFQRG